MAGLNYRSLNGSNYLVNKKFFNTEGVIYSDKSNKWVVRARKKGINSKREQISTIAQFDTESEAIEFYNNLKT